MLDDLGDRRGYCHLKEKALDRINGGIVLEETVDLSSWQITDDDEEPFPQYPLDMRLGGPQSRAGRRGEEKILDHTGTRTPTPRSFSP
jgi:hypothetical protein